MALQSFFDIAMPYCLEKTGERNWTVLNREYQPIGFNIGLDINSSLKFTAKLIPIHSDFVGLHNDFINELLGTGNSNQRLFNEKGEIVKFWLYNDATNPSSNHHVELYTDYFNKIIALSKLHTPATYRTINKRYLLEDVFYKIKNDERVISHTVTIIKGAERKVFNTLKQFKNITNDGMNLLGFKGEIFEVHEEQENRSILVREMKLSIVYEH